METVVIDGKIWAGINQLTPWEQNPREMTEVKLHKLVKQLLKLKQYKPLIVTPQGVVLGGNMRLRAYRYIVGLNISGLIDYVKKRLGWTLGEAGALGLIDYYSKLWVSIVEPKNKNEEMEFALSDNDPAGHYSTDLLANIMHEYDIEWDDYGAFFRDADSLKYLADLANKTEEDGKQEIMGDPKSKLGEIYQLGKHRLLCGDSTDPNNLLKLMGDKKATLVFTDPPYNVNYDYTSKFDHIHHTETGSEEKHAKVFNDNVSKADFAEFVDNLLKNAYIHSTADMSYYIWFADKWMPLLRELLMTNNFMFSQNIVWIKENFVIAQSQDFHKMYEVAAHGWKKGGKHYFNKLLSNASDVWNLNENINLMEESDVWIVKRDAVGDRIHPTQKPVKMIEIALKKSSLVGDVVLDLFAGSGSTLIACEQLDRVCYTCELDPRFVDLIRKRYAKLVGKESEWEIVTRAL